MVPRRPPPPEILTLGEAAELIRVHPRSLREHAARGEVPGAFRTWEGGPWRFDRRELLRKNSAQARTVANREEREGTGSAL